MHSADGSPMHLEKVTKAFATAVKAAGITRVRLHDPRHTHSSLMLTAGVSPTVVSERLGQSSINVIMDGYSHALPGLQEVTSRQVV